MNDVIVLTEIKLELNYDVNEEKCVNFMRTKPNWKPYLSATTVAQKRNVTFILAATV